MKKLKKGFTLIELLVAISIIGILMGIVGPKVFDLLTTSTKTKYSSIFSAWVTQLTQYKSHYGHFPPFLYEEEEGVAIKIDDEDLHDSFLASLKGKVRDASGSWVALDEDLIKQNRENREFHSFGDNEFLGDGKVIGYDDLYVLIDQDGDGAIELSDDLVEDILDSLKQDFSSDEIDEIDKDVFGVVNHSVIIFLLQNTLDDDDDEKYKEDVSNVFSWNVDKYFD